MLKLENLNDDAWLAITDHLPNREFGRWRRTCKRANNLRYNKYALNARKCRLYRNFGQMLSCRHKFCLQYVRRWAPARSISKRHLVQIATELGDVKLLRQLWSSSIKIRDLALVNSTNADVMRFLIEMGYQKKDVDYNIFMLSHFNDEVFYMLFGLGITVGELFENVETRIIRYLLTRNKFGLLNFLLDEIVKAEITQVMRMDINGAYWMLIFKEYITRLSDDEENLKTKLKLCANIH